MTRLGIVVATHPEDHSVDLVMSNGERLVGVQVQTSNGSTRSGTTDLPAVPEKKDKWDITKPTGQEMKAIVTMIEGRLPVVTGFLYPQINQMLLKDPKARLTRHQSDVYSYTDGDGNSEWVHPSGAYVRVGETPDHVDLTKKNADESLALDRNTARKPFVRVHVPGAFTLTMSPQGQVTFNVEQGASIQFGGDVSIKAPKITLDTPLVSVPDGDVVAKGVSLTEHLHGGVVRGGSLTDKPER